MATIAQLVALVETGNNPLAERFEPALFNAQIASARATAWQPAIIEIQAAHENAWGSCSHETAVRICFTSFGRYQLLGGNIWDPQGAAYAKTFRDFQDDGAAQDQAFEVFRTNAGIGWTWQELVAAPDKAREFVAKYNGPGGWPGYWEALTKAAASLQLTTTAKA